MVFSATKLKITHVDSLADPVDPAHALLQPNRVPRQVVVDHQVAELEVDPLAGGLGCDADLPVLMERPAGSRFVP